MSDVRNAMRLVHCTILKDFRTVGRETGRGIYDTGSGGAVIVDYDLDRFGRVHETFSIGDGNHDVRITVRNSDVKEPQDPETTRARLRLMLDDLCDGVTQRLTRIQKRRMDVVGRLAALWNEGRETTSVRFHPATSLSGGWVEPCMRITDRGIVFSGFAEEILGPQRKGRPTLSGSRNSFNAEARSDLRVLWPVTEPLERLREICSLREEATAIGIDPGRLDAVMTEARL